MSRLMRKGVRHVPASTASAAAGAKLVALSQTGNWAQLEIAADRVTRQFAALPLGWRALGLAQLQLGKPADAVAALTRAATLAPGDAKVHNDIGVARMALGQKRDAAASYRRALERDPRFAEAAANLGWILCDLGETAEGVTYCRRAVALNPGSAISHNNLGIGLRDLGDMAGAEAAYRQALALRPDYLEALVNLGTLLSDVKRIDEALACYRQAVQVNPSSLPALNALGKLLSSLRIADEEAIDCLRRAIALAPDDATAYSELGNVLMNAGQKEAALDMFRRGQALRPLITRRAAQEFPTFSALFLDTPLAGSTPIDYLSGRAAYERNSFCVMPGALEDLDLLRGKADVVFNMIADPDGGEALLPQVLDLVERIGRPTVNHPRAVMGTKRDVISARLADITGCVVPRTARVAGPVLAAAVAGRNFESFRLPLLVRLAGTHGGDDFEKCDDWPAVGEMVARHPDASFYLSEYVDYRSADGFFRKYRVIFIDGGLFAYHLAIHDHWKVHHYRADMANQPWMRAEEEGFLSDMSGVFDAERQFTLRKIAAATGLDYGGIDCSRDAAGRILVFEANASMLVHDEPEGIFAYKNPYVARIKNAFDLMLDRRRAAA